MWRFLIQLNRNLESFNAKEFLNINRYSSFLYLGLAGQTAQTSDRKSSLQSSFANWTKSSGRSFPCSSGKLNIKRFRYKEINEHIKFRGRNKLIYYSLHKLLFKYFYINNFITILFRVEQLPFLVLLAAARL